MMFDWMRWLWFEVCPLILTIAFTHLAISGGQTLMHCWLGHRRIGSILFRNHIKFHHARYIRGRLVSAADPGKEGNNTPFFLIPVFFAAAAMFFVLPFDLFIAVSLAGAASFYAHVHFDKAYHVEGAFLGRYAWFRRKQQLHFVHHLHADRNFAVIDFFWDRVFRTFRDADRVIT